MSFASLRRHALITSAGVATAVILPLGGIALVAPAAHAATTTGTTTTSTPDPTATATVPTAAEIAAAKKAAAEAAAKKAAAKKAAEKKAAAKRAAAKRAAAKKKAAAKKARHRAAVAHRKAMQRKRAKKILIVAARYKGRPYVYGASGPRAFDCSGYTSFVVRNAIHVNLPRTAQEQSHARRVKHVSKSHRMIGDLIFFHSGSSVYHVGIYAGHGTMWAAPHTGSYVHKQKIFSSNVTYGRIV